MHDKILNRHSMFGKKSELSKAETDCYPYGMAEGVIMKYGKQNLAYDTKDAQNILVNGVYRKFKSKEDMAELNRQISKINLEDRRISSELMQSEYYNGVSILYENDVIIYQTVDDVPPEFLKIVRLIKQAYEKAI